jgi:branched-chain amino acid aminotransferase
MLTIRYDDKQGWHDYQISPYAPLSMDPASMVFHYGQAIFEGLKAYKLDDGRTVTFRPQQNFARMNRSAERMCMAQIPEADVLEGLVDLLKLDERWVPKSAGTSLYIRPTLIATDPMLGVHASHTYLFFIILSPVGPYYAEGFNPVKIYVEDEYVRAVKGGTGFTKCAGNYAASILAASLAEKKGYTQVLWLDSKYHKFIEEVGSMNIFFKIDGTLITAPLHGSILPGVTRDSVLQLAKEMGVKTQERELSIEEVFEAAENGKLDEAFGTGTAAVISAVGEITWKDKTAIINDGKMGKVSQAMYDRLVAIQYGKAQGPKGWSVTVE